MLERPTTVAVSPAATEAPAGKPAIRVSLLGRAVAGLKRLARFAYDLLTRLP